LRILIAERGDLGLRLRDQSLRCRRRAARLRSGARTRGVRPSSPGAFSADRFVVSLANCGVTSLTFARGGPVGRRGFALAASSMRAGGRTIRARAPGIRRSGCAYVIKPFVCSTSRHAWRFDNRWAAARRAWHRSAIIKTTCPSSVFRAGADMAARDRITGNFKPWEAGRDQALSAPSLRRRAFDGRSIGAASPDAVEPRQQQQ
jgi:hypothetical protein